MGDIINLSEMDIEQLNKLVTTLCEYIGEVNLANELKIPTFLKFKAEETEKIEPLLFMKSVMIRLSEMMLGTQDMLYADLIRITSKFIADMNSKSLNKQSVIDNWIIQLHLTANGGKI